MALDAPIHTNEANLARVLSAGLPVVLVFWRNACAPCEEYAPTLDRLAKKWAGQALVVKVDADSEAGLVSKYQVSGLPSSAFVRSGKSIATAEGRLPEPAIDAWMSFLVRGGEQPDIPFGPSIALPGVRRVADRPHGGDAARSETSRRDARSSGAPIVLTDADFDAVLRSTQLPIMVDFWAAWCGPCKMIAPAVAELARDFAGRAVVGKVDVDNNPLIAERYNVMSIPTLLIFRDGKVIDQLVGAHPAQILRDHLSRAVS